MSKKVLNQKIKTKKEERAKVWACILYPDSLPMNFIDQISLLHVPCLLSPLHSSDDDDKKKHYHFMIKFDSLKSQWQVETMLSDLNGTKPFIVQAPSSYIRYLIHYDDPKKEQFSSKDDPSGILKIVSFAGWDYIKAFENDNQRNTALQKISQIIFDNEFYNFLDLYKFLYENELYIELSYLFKNTYYISSMLNGVYQKRKYQHDFEVHVATNRSGVNKMSDKLEDSKEQFYFNKIAASVEKNK